METVAFFMGVDDALPPGFFVWVAGLAIIALAFLAFPSLRRSVVAFWRGSGHVVTQNLTRMWDEWAPVLKTRTGSNALVMKLIGFTGIGLSAGHVAYAVTFLMTAALVWSFLRTLNGRAHASGPVGPASTLPRQGPDALERAGAYMPRHVTFTPRDSHEPPRGGVLDDTGALAFIQAGLPEASDPRPPVDAFRTDDVAKLVTKGVEQRPQPTARRSRATPTPPKRPPTKAAQKRPAKKVTKAVAKGRR